MGEECSGTGGSIGEKCSEMQRRGSIGRNAVEEEAG